MNDSPEAVQKVNSAVAEDGGLLAFPASVSQQLFWDMELLQGEVTAFNVPLQFQLDGVLDVVLLERALNTVIERHEVLRTHFCKDRGELLQIVAPDLELKMNVIDISHLPADRIDEEASRLGTVEACRPFRLSAGPLIRAELVRRATDSHIFHVTVHHALFDGMSMGVLAGEIAEIYQAYFEGKPCPLQPLAIQYGDFSVWQKQFLEGPEIAAQLAFWKKRLEGMAELNLPTDFPRPAVKTWKGDIISTLLPTHLTDRLQEIAGRRGATLFHLQLAAFNILLHRYCGTTDIAIGTTITGRTHPEVEPLIGDFINTLILRNDLSGNPPFGRLVEKVRDNTLEALKNQDLPFEYLVRELKPERDQSPLFQVNFSHHPSFVRPGRFGGVTLTSIPSRCPGTLFDLQFSLVERENGWRLACEYSTDLFTRDWAERMLGQFKRLMEDIASGPEQTIADLGILTDSGKSQMSAERAGITNDYPRDAPIGAAKEPAREASRDRSDRGAVVTLSKGASEPPLVCIHEGDGTILVYRDLVALLPDSVAVHAIESPELGKSGSIEPATIEETAAAYIENLLAIQPKGPYRLAGYSFGGVVAHEMACQLERLGHVVQFVGLFDTHNPASHSRKYGLLERLRVFWDLNSGIPYWKRFHLLRRRIGEGFRTKRRVKAELAAAAHAGPAEAYSDLRRILVREENRRAMNAYKPGPFNGRITLFKAIAMSDKIERPADYGWACNAASGLDIMPVPGEHLTLFAPEHIETLAKALTTALRKHSRSTSSGIA